MQRDQPYDAPFCPSFSSYSSNNQIADVAARVAAESPEATTTTAVSASTTADDKSADLKERNHLSDDENGDFEFVLVREDQSETVFPVFNHDLLLDDVAETVMLPLKQLFLEDQRDPPSSSSSSEADELEAIPPGTYCVWTPKASPSPGRCKKSNSTGSSASAAAKPRWRLRDLLRRSSSDGKHSLVFLNQSSSVRNNNEKKAEKGKTASSGKEKVSAHEAFYVRSKALKEGDKRKSYLPYRQDLVGFFANANLGRTLPPF